MHLLRHQSGFSIIELSVAFAVFVILGTFAAPSLKDWQRTYMAKTAARDLFSNLQSAKIGAVKENRQWRVAFNSSGAYSVLRCLNTVCDGGTVNVDYAIVKSVSFAEAYQSEIQFLNPQSSTTQDKNPLIFLPNGLADQNGFGFVYLGHSTAQKYYRVGTMSMAGSVVIQRWNGSGWE